MKTQKTVIISLLSLILLLATLICAVSLFAMPYKAISEISHVECDALPHHRERLFGYLQSSISTASSRSHTAGERLESVQLHLYNEIAARLSDVAAGKLASTEFAITSGLDELSWTADELGCRIIENGQITAKAEEEVNEEFNDEVSVHSLLYAIIEDFPYELYWFDKL